MIYGICVEFQPELNKDFRLDGEVARVMQNLGYVKRCGLWINPTRTVVETIVDFQQLSHTLEWLSSAVEFCTLVTIKEFQDLHDAL